MKKYLIKGRILTPIHIGCGDEMDPLQYFIKNRVMYVIDQQKFIANLSERKRAEFISLIDRNRMIELRSFIRDNALPDKNAGDALPGYIIYTAKVSDTIALDYSKKVSDKNLRNQLLIHTFIRQPYSPTAYIPGSSLKGAIRTAVLDYLLNGEENMGEKVHLYENERYPNNKARILEAETLENVYEYGGRARVNIKRDPFRMVKVYDMPLPQGAIEVRLVRNVSLKSLTDSYADEGIPMVYELVAKKTKFEGEIDLLIEERDNINRLARDRDKIKREIDLDLILDACDEYYYNGMFEEYKHFNELSPKYYKGLEQAFQAKKDNEAIIRLGKFSQVEFMTLNEFRDPKTSFDKPYEDYGKTRNLADGKIPMGWVKIGFYEV